MNIYPDGTMKYSLDQPIGEMGPYERKLYQDYYGSEYNWEYCRWYWPIAIEWDEAQQDYVEVEDEVIVGSVEPSAISWDAMEFYLPGIVQVSDGQYMALFSYPYINNVLMFTDGSEFVLDEPIVILRGDANNDGEVNIADVATLIDHILNDDFDDCDEFNSDASDTNLDGSISLIDVVTLIDYVLEGAWNN